jgi:tetratricopeptide (TPR) repeat protein
MIYKSLFGVLAVAIIVVASAITGSAQTGELRGKVLIQQADGQKVGLAEANIDVFRTDMSMSKPYTTKTNKKGEFVFAGLPFVGTYTVAASHATAQPNFLPGVKVGKDIPYEITVTPGNGKRLTFDEIKAAGGGTAAAPPTGGGASAPPTESAADKAKREELIKKNKEIEEGNKKIEAANATIGRTFKAGNEALNAANLASKANNSTEAIAKYTEAITQYAEGLTADPEQPALLTNQAVALKGRGVERYNSSIKATDDAARNAALEGAKADFKAASESSGKAVTLLKATPAPADPADLQRLNANKFAAFMTHAETMRLFVTKVDGTQTDAGLTAFKDYIGVETDAVKKAKAELDAAQMLLDAGDGAKALAQYQSILSTQPDNPDANLGAGLSLYALGEKTKFQEAANYLQRFVDVAPNDHKFKTSAKEILTALKESENVVPEKSTPPKRGTKRP